MDGGMIIEQEVPSANLTCIKFSVLTEADIEKLSVLSINIAADVTSAKLGLPNEASECLTCGSKHSKKCDGHFGFIKLPMDIFHPYYVSDLVKILNSICPACKCCKSELRTKGSSTSKKAVGTPNDQPSCNYCSGNSQIWWPKITFKATSRVGKMALTVSAEISEKLPKKFQNKKLSEVLPPDYWSIIKTDPSQEDIYLNSNTRCLSAYQVYHLMKDIDPMKIGRLVRARESLFLTCVPVTSNGNRVTEKLNKLIFDERTKAYKRLVDFKGVFNELGVRVRDCLSASKLHTDNSLNVDVKSGSKWLKDVILSKRSDHSFRMVVVGDPNIRLGDIGMPQNICQSLVISETLNDYNKDKLYDYCNRSLFSMGGFRVKRKDSLVIFRNLNDLEIGDTVYRHLDEGDLLLVNRPPSIHQHSLIALSVRVLPVNSVVSLNPVCCSPLRGDFDGDCLHGYIPQSIKSKVELGELASIDRQLINGQNGRNLLSFSHDSLTAAFLLRERSVFLDKFQMQQMGMLFAQREDGFDASVFEQVQRQLLNPAIHKATGKLNPVWTGNQLFSMLFPLDFNYNSPSNGILISKGEITYSSLESSWLQDTDNNIFSSLIRCYGSKANEILLCAERVLVEWMSERGLSVSLSDLYLCSNSYSRSKMLEEVCYGLHEAEQKFLTEELMVDHAMVSDDEDDLDFEILEAAQSVTSKKVTVLNQASLGAFKEVFRDLQTAVLTYTNSENSLLAMARAGSKGNLLKLIQQGVALGLQHSSIPLSFSIPSKSKFKSDNQAHDTQKTSENNVPYAVVESSFLKGLDPLECFVHSVSSRSVSFADNAEVPGTIFKKLMFFMRDLYVAYDGTVRSSCGNHLYQFSYGVPKESPIQNNINDVEFSDSTYDSVQPGDSVGSLAACSISEAAYSALDQPISTLESSPLLNLKSLLESSLKKTATNPTVSLFLSKRLARWLYGFEYGAIKVKNHLERVLFSDVVSTVMIKAYRTPFKSNNKSKGNSSNVSISHQSPWEIHFHLCKEGLGRRGLDMRFIIKALRQECNSIVEKLKIDFATLKILDGSCADAQKENDGALCITLSAEVPMGSPMLMDIFRNSVIPSLLGTVIRGFFEIKKVDILWNDLSNSSKSNISSSGELYMKVHFTESCKSGKCWNLLMNKCLRIMDLIDWERSYPDNIPDVYYAFGINCARDIFHAKLKVVASDIGKVILPKHLLLVADCLSATGEFFGLNAKGMERQRDLAAVSSPFTQACFSNPESCFIKAAKEQIEDDLLGVLDAAAWGKEIPLGTGGKFDLLYSGKGHEVSTSVDIFSNSSPLCSNLKAVFDKCHELSPIRDEKMSRFSNSNVTWSQSFDDLRNRHIDLQRILHNEYSVNELLSESDKTKLIGALNFHPQKDKKIGTGIQDIKVGKHPDYQKSRCFFVVRKDGSVEDFSYHKCIIGYARSLGLNFCPITGVSRVKSQRLMC